MKRSRTLVMTGLMAAAGVSLTACDSAADWDAAQNPADRGPSTDVFAYRTLEGCKKADEIPDEACDSGWAAAQKEQAEGAPRYDKQATCEEVYGAGQCVPRSSAQGSFWGPLITGFVVGRMLDNMGGGWRGAGLYRDGRDGGYYTGYGGRVWTDYSTGRTRTSVRALDPPDSVKYAPPKVQTRTSVVSRGGFGGRMGGHYGG
jgi:uncharacterized protein YgiB involved in biofilm formation